MNIINADTIAALATPRGSGGIGIIKISGPGSMTILERIFAPARRSGFRNDEFEHQCLVYGHIVHPLEGPLDEVLISVMRAPHSYTTEDVVEINCHGGVVVTQEVLDLVLAQGARPAEPGEFTRRAFLGGRINLSQAEAVIDLINAKTRQAAQTVLQQLANGIDRQVQHYQDMLLESLAEVEAFIDFDDDLEETFSLNPVAERIQNQLLPAIETLIKSHRQGRIIKEGLRIVIAGSPNVGKSSLVNRLLNQERVIVNPTPGTTRDIIEEVIAIDGAPIVITDTAGIHDSHDPVETIGIEKSWAVIEKADLVLFMIDGSRTVQVEEQALYESLRTQEHLVVRNKIDLCDPPTEAACLEGVNPEAYVNLSALTGDGLDTLRERLQKKISLGGDPAGSTIVINLRQRHLLEALRAHLQKACELLSRAEDYELVAIEIKDGLGNLQEILGQGAAPDVLDTIFRRFCIGK